MNWRDALTDDRGELDVAQLGVAVSIVWMLSLASWQRGAGIVLDFMQLGTGIASVIGALGIYKWGDKRPM